MTALAARFQPVASFAKRRLSLVKSTLANAFESETDVDPGFDEMMATFHESRLAFERAEDLFWRMRVQCEELRLENELLKEQLRVKPALRITSQP